MLARRDRRLCHLMMQQRRRRDVDNVYRGIAYQRPPVSCGARKSKIARGARRRLRVNVAQYLEHRLDRHVEHRAYSTKAECMRLPHEAGTDQPDTSLCTHLRALILLLVP